MVTVVSLLVVLILVAGLRLQARETSVSTGQVYSLAQIQAHLAQQPGQWLGRTVRLFALAQPCPTWGSPSNPLHCASWQPELGDPDDMTLDPPLRLAAGPSDPLLDLLGRLLVVRQLLPLQRLVWERPVAYRVRLGVQATRPCIASSCYEVLLLDAAPGSL
jgi:hypothetical protein